MKKSNTNIFKLILPYFILAIAIFGTLFFLNNKRYTVHELTTGELLKEVKSGTITEIEITPKSSESGYYVEGKLKDYKETESFKTFVIDKDITDITEYAKANAVAKYEQHKDPGANQIFYVIMNVIPLLLLMVGLFWLVTKMTSSNKNSMDFGRSRAKLAEDTGQVTFGNVAGLTEEKEEVSELIDFLRNPKKFQRLGARIPKGVLLVGPPGTGKTLLAKAVAGEANVPFYYISGSDFVELYVGVGASRVRDMFKEAKRNAPCLIFIDEIDAVGRQRGTGLGGGHDEREQTLNQLLTEMDGFGANEGIIIIAATNRPDVLDPALLRPGRFDRQVTVSLPDAKAREEILQVHAKGKIFAADINLENISKRTPGFSGADLENLLNEASLLAVRRNKEAITMEEIDEATDRVLMGPAKTTRKITDNEKRIVALHEAGHAVIGLKYPNADDVHKITIIPRGMAGGYNLMLPKEEKMIVRTKGELMASIITSLGGRAAEELFVKEITTGASGDFKSSTELARKMVTVYGMSDLGPIQYEQAGGDVFLGRDYTKQNHMSDQFAEQIDAEIKKIIEHCYEEAKKTLGKNEKLVNLIADTLMEVETLTKEQIDSLVNTGTIKKEVKEEKPEEKKPIKKKSIKKKDEK